MNALAWTLQILLAFHTAVGAVWKSSNSERIMPTLAAIPHALWQSMIVVELLCAIALIVPVFERRAAIVAPIAAIVIGAEMLFLSGVHLASGSTSIGPVVYWLVVAAVCAFVAYWRLARKPVRRGEFA
jgi:hypothetical protein